jgi:hypothetical protein
MAFTAGELTNISNAALDFYMNKGKTFKQSIQAKPMLALMEAGKKTFPGGKGSISLGVKGVYGAAGVNDSVVGYTHNDTVNFYTPANIQRANFPWREHHIGLTLTHTELKIDGISVTDETGDGSSTSQHSDRDMTVLVGLLEDKLDDFGEQYSRTMNTLLWGDGVSDAKALAGIRSIITATPGTGVVGGLSRVTYPWWRNRSRTAAMAAAIVGTPGLAAWGGDAVTSAPTDGGVLLQALTKEYLQLCRYGARPNKAFAGSDFLAALQKERRANGTYSQTGFDKSQSINVGDSILPGGAVPEYDPTLDDLGLSKRMYWWDSRHIYLMAMEGEWNHQFTPSRPTNQFAMYKSLTHTGQLVTQQMNGALVIDIT